MSKHNILENRSLTKINRETHNNSFENKEQDSFMAYNDKIKINIPKVQEYLTYNLHRKRISKEIKSPDSISVCSSLSDLN